MSEIETAINQYLTFHLDEEVYAFPVSQVREVLGHQAIRKIPRMPDFLTGIINVRDSVVPVVDFRIHFGFPPHETTLDTSIIVVELYMNDAYTVLGILVDSVNEVIEILPSNIEGSKNFGFRMSDTFIKGIGRLDDKVIIIIDLIKSFHSEVSIVQEITSNNEQ
ncbi:chemotaxis protein CheW [Spirochaeta cellobiosiphila]|uniref:chemotaxis protein CheW n=1 Tax=Spirochaeta cellobiosiphila TaxID=504483 RepID=UPI0004097FFA|nr:chemotaxis protein CheW [Spirochaeta cellobiosiphila]